MDAVKRSLELRMVLNGISVQNGSDPTLDGSQFVKGDYRYVEVTPNDGMEDGTSLSSSFIVIGNTVPSNLVVSVTSSDNFNNDSTLTCSASVDDLDVDENVDSLSYTYTWSTGDTGSTLDLAYVNFTSPGSITPGDSVTCDVTVTDGDDSVSGSDSQSIGNRSVGLCCFVACDRRNRLLSVMPLVLTWW